MSPAKTREGAEALGESQGSAPEVLRVVLDKGAAESCERIAQALKAEGFVRVAPSRLVSFVLSLYFANHFEKDKDLLLSEFFDSKAYVEGELKKVSDPAEVGAALERAMLKVRRMQELRKRGARSRRAPSEAAKASGGAVDG